MPEKLHWEGAGHQNGLCKGLSAPISLAQVSLPGVSPLSWCSPSPMGAQLASLSPARA